MMIYQVLSNDNFKFGYNAATGQYEDLMAAGIIDPTKVCSPMGAPTVILCTILKWIECSLDSWVASCFFNWAKPPFFFWEI